ncbi:MAG: prolipoprotein diacylglyceryl transferase [Ruminococcus sp.]|nr:prolipoprotein diacylglyceryl transferase [Ruminococcus sp.]
MFPQFELFGKTISMYMVCALVGVLFVLLLTYKLAKKRGLDEINMLFMMLLSFVGVIVFSHILYAVTVFDKIVLFFSNLDKVTSFDDFIYGMSVIFGGSVFYGGLIGAIFVFYIYTKSKKLSFGDYSDIGALAIPLFHFFGRIGCFLSGCCYGVEWEHGITYEHSLVESANGVPRFPVQLCEAVLNLLLFLLLFYLYKKGKANHKILALYLLIYPVYRFILEFFRGDSYRGFLFGLSTSQLISIILFAVSAGYLVFSHFKEKKASSA